MPGAKLTERALRIIRENPDGLTLAELSQRFGVTISTVSKARSRLTWTGEKKKGVPLMAGEVPA